MRTMLGAAGGLLLVACGASRQSLSAGQVGCRPSEITISEETVGNDGFSVSSENWVAECNGTRFICTQIDNRGFVHTGTSTHPVMTTHSDVSCKEEHSSSSSEVAATRSPPPAPSAPPPKGGAGFELGAKAEAAQAACEAAGQAWQVDANTGTCSGPAAELGFPASITLKLCSGAVCGIGLVHRPENNWLDIIAELRNGLESKYGPAREREGEVHQDCRAKSAFVACLLSRRTRLRYVWSWPSGEKVLLLVGIPPDGGEAAIRLDYSKPARALSVNESAL